MKPVVATTPAKKRQKKERSTGKLDELIDKMAQSLEQTEKQIKERKESNEFYTMIGKRAATLSDDTQRWMEDQVWALYRRAEEMDRQTSKPCTSQERKPATPTSTG